MLFPAVLMIMNIPNSKVCLKWEWPIVLKTIINKEKYMSKLHMPYTAASCSKSVGTLQEFVINKPICTHALRQLVDDKSVASC